MRINDRDDVRAQLALEGRLTGWQVYRAREARLVAPVGDLTAKVEVPAGWCWAVHWHPDEPPAVAETLAELERLVGERTPPERSMMREMLGDDADRFEVAPGRWYLPGTPP